LVVEFGEFTHYQQIKDQRKRLEKVSVEV